MKRAKPLTIGAGEFKARCLQLMEEVNRTGRELVITKRGRAVAKLVAVEAEPVEDLVGSMKGTVTVHADLVGSDPADWGALA